MVFIPKCHRRTLSEQLRRHLGEVFRNLAQHKEGRIREAHLTPDHVHTLISIPPKYAVQQVVGYIKGKSAIHLARVYGGLRSTGTGESLHSAVGHTSRAPPSLAGARHPALG